jgi:phage baseplate assembly protein W
MPKEKPGVVFPLEMTDDNAGYRAADLRKAVSFNIKNIILTNPGERIMIPDFGVGIQRALFERISINLLQGIQDRILEQISIYASYITILQIQVIPIDDVSINVKLKYKIDFAEIVDTLDIEISNI